MFENRPALISVKHASPAAFSFRSAKNTHDAFGSSASIALTQVSTMPGSNTILDTAAMEETPLGVPLVVWYERRWNIFAISGFLISASFERSHNLANYFRNRFLRIFPALWCVVLLTVLGVGHS